MTIPEKCTMPDLLVLDSPLTNRLIVRLLVGDKDMSTNAILYRTNFVRLIDKAIREYKSARELVIAQTKESKRSTEEMMNGRYLYIIRFPDYMETCINALSRLYKLLIAIGNEKKSPQIPRSVRRLLLSQNDSVNNIRNSIEHMDKEIQSSSIAGGKPMALSINDTNDGILISGFGISFQDLAIVLKNMNEVAFYLLKLKTVS